MRVSVRVFVEFSRVQKKGRARKWRGKREEMEREEEEVDRVGEMTAIEKNVVYFALLLNKRSICK